MKQLSIIAFIVLLAWSCKDKKGSSEEGLGVEDFIELFPEVKLPYYVADSNLTRRTKDSLIPIKVFNQFVPDSVVKKDFGIKGTPRIYAVGRTREKGKETYLFAKAIQGNKRVGYLICFDKDNNYKNSMTLVRLGFENYNTVYGTLDPKFQITTYRDRKKTDGSLSYKRNVYIYNSAGNVFTLILTEPNEEMIENIINPIDTLAKKHKFSGDYVVNKQNFLSFRDGKNDKELQFFVHFEKDKGTCVGELKGTAKLVSSKTAQYKVSGNPCTIEFTFSPTYVVMKELEGCGSFREIKCFFEGRYPKKKETKPKPTKKKAA